LKVCPAGEVTTTLSALRESPATARQKAKFILATDGASFEAENLVDGETIACNYPDFHDYFGFFLPLAGITTVKVPRFSKIARSYLLHVGNLDWTKINPDIFGSMIQAVADDEERSALGMHYTSVPNILKVERLEKLFELYTKMTAQQKPAKDKIKP
jgi:hypothetical protein